MAESLPILLVGGVLGFTYCALPGVVNTESIRRGLTGGARPSLLVQLGAIGGHLVWATLGLTGAALIQRFNAATIVLGLIGAGFLFALARNAILSALHPRPTESAASRPTGRPLVVGITLSIANPAGLAFWSGIGGGYFATLDDPTRLQIGIILSTFVVGAVLWSVLISIVVSWGRRFATPTLFRWVDAISGTALSYFGIRLLITSARRLGRWVIPGVRALA